MKENTDSTCYDIFISHSSKDIDIIKPIVEEMRARGVKCWLSETNINSGGYAKAIIRAIEQSKIFLLCLSKNSAISEHVLNEIEMVYNKRKIGLSNIIIEPFLLDDIDIDSKDYDEIMYYVRRIQFINILHKKTPQEIADLIIKKNNDILKLNQPKKPDRQDSLYFPSEKESIRLKIQNEITKHFDKEVYQEIFKRYRNQEVCILDVGCGNGDLIISRLNNYARSYKLCAFDKDAKAIAFAKEHYASKYNFFYELDILDQDFEEKLKEVTNISGINQFDIVHISMVLLHLKNPVRLLRILRRIMKDNGTIIIKDIDDGLNFAYPDEKGFFDRIYSICDSNETSGNRHSGRQVYSNLLKSGFKNIIIRKEGLSSAGMTYEEKENLFAMYCQFVFRDVIWMHQKYPNNNSINEDYQWFTKNYNLIFDRFMEEDFIFSLGFQIYLGKK